MAIHGIIVAASVIESYPLPEGLHWWVCPPPVLSEGQAIFPVYCASGELESRYVAYLVKGPTSKLYAIDLRPDDSEYSIIEKVQHAIEVLNGN